MSEHFIGLDTEGYDLSTSLDPDTPLWCVSLAWEDGMTEVKKWDDSAKEYLNALIEAGAIFVIHNATHDVPTLRLRGVNLAPGTYVDSLLASYLHQPDGMQYHKLEALGRVLGVEKVDYRAELIKEGLLDANAPKGDEYKIPYNYVMEKYAAQDALIALRWWEHLNKPEFYDEDLWRSYYEIELPYQEVIIQMEQTGSYMDRAFLEELRVQVEKELKELESEVTSIQLTAPDASWDKETKRYVGKVIKYKEQSCLDTDADGNCKGGYTSWNRTLTSLGKVTKPKNREHDPSSGPSPFYTYTFEHCKIVDFEPKSSHLAWFLMEYGGWKPKRHELTESGLPGTSADILEKVEVNGTKPQRLINAVLKHSNLSKLYSTYIVALLAASEKDGYVHGSFIQNNTKTTRLSSSEPNLQNIDPRVKPAFIAPPGYIIAIADLDRIELVVLAWYLETLFGDSSMADPIRQGIDIHQANATNWSIARKVAKVVIFLLVYGGGVKKLAVSAKKSEDEAKEILDKVLSALPALVWLKEWVIERAHDVQSWQWQDVKTGETVVDGFMRLYGGNRVYVPEIFSDGKWKRGEAERQLGNYIIQGSAGVINKILHLATYLESRKYQAKPFIVVHDENGLYIPLEHATRGTQEALTGTMSSRTMLPTSKGGVPVTGAYQFGFDWDEAKSEVPKCNLKNKRRWVEWLVGYPEQFSSVFPLAK